MSKLIKSCENINTETVYLKTLIQKYEKKINKQFYKF